MENSAEITCSFCAKGKEHYRYIVTSGTGATICDGCVIVATEEMFRQSKMAQPDVSMDVATLQGALANANQTIANLRELISMVNKEANGIG